MNTYTRTTIYKRAGHVYTKVEQVQRWTVGAVMGELKGRNLTADELKVWKASRG